VGNFGTAILGRFLNATQGLSLPKTGGGTVPTHPKTMFTHPLRVLANHTAKAYFAALLAALYTTRSRTLFLRVMQGKMGE
jgi:hypothetical protein